METKQTNEAIGILCVFLFFLCLICSSIAATSAEIEAAIENGVAWLAAQQNSSDGYWADGANRAGPTGLALVKLQERAFELGYTPFDTSYAYHENVEDGFVYLFGRLASINITTQLYGNPDTDSDGIGIYLPGNDTYDTGIAMMAIASSRAPDRIVNAPGSAVHGWTYKQVLTDMVDYMAFGQYDYAPSRGGWGYSHNSSNVDNSNSGYAVSGLGYAQSTRYGFECVIPQFLKDELLVWTDYVQTDSADDEDGGSGYTGPGSGSTLRTGNLVYQMTFAGRASDHTNVQRGVNYIGRQWNDANQNPGWGNPAYYSGDPHYQAMYCAANGLSYARIDNIPVSGQPRDWYADFADALVEAQETNGSWTADIHGGAVLATEWALLALERPAFLLDLVKTDNVDEPNCVSPGQEFKYTICWDNDSGRTIEDAYIVDWLPDGVDCDYLISVTPRVIDANYNDTDHSYRWDIGDIGPNDSGCVQLTVTVNQYAEPGLCLYNLAEMYSNDRVVGAGDDYTPVCCWDTTDPDIIFVDKTAHGNNNGTSWSDAYMDLQDALNRAAKSTCSQNFKIYVAQGSYLPGNTSSISFVLPEGTSVYGGFPTGGSDFSRRNPKVFESILTGKIDDTHRVDTVVTVVNKAFLDGFTITSAAKYGIYVSGVDFAIENCTVIDSLQYGIRAINGNVNLKWCYVKNNRIDGIRHDGAGYVLKVENCWIMRNQKYGVNCQNSTPIVKNSIVSESDLSEYGNAGINLYNPTTKPLLQNCTFAHNRNVGIAFSDADSLGDPNKKDYPDIQNCLLWYNNDNHEQMTGVKREFVYHSCVYDPNDPSGVRTTKDVNFNFSTNPKLVYLDPNNIHIKSNSPCKDVGAPGDYINQEDMDHIERKVGPRVDVGAYEISCIDIASDADFNVDGIVNMIDFKTFSKAWNGHDPNDPAWLADPNQRDPNLSEGWCQWKYKCNLDKTQGSAYSIDLADLMAFLDEYLWIACWRTDIYNPYDFSGDGLVNYQEFEFFASAWLSHTGNLNWCYPCNLHGDDEIDLDDLMMFLEYAPWLWVSDFRTDVLVPTPPQSLPLAQPPQTPPQTPPQEPNIVPEPELSIEEQIAQLQESIAFLENLWETDPDIQQQISAEEWQAFMDQLYTELAYLQSLLEPQDPNDLFSGMGMMMSQSMMESESLSGKSLNSSQQEIADLQDSLQFLESLWDDPQFRQEISKKEWQEFMDSVKSSLYELEKYSGKIESSIE